MGKIIDHFLFFAQHINDDKVTLDKDETRHALTVLRIVIGDLIFITDGKGTIYFCMFSDIQSECCVAKIIDKKRQEVIEPRVHVFVGLPEKDPFESLLKTLTPLGVASITPVECRYCQKRWWLKHWVKNSIRFQKKMVTAAKQSWNAWFPLLYSPVTFDAAISADHGSIILSDENGEYLLNLPDNSNLTSSKNISCFVGPPGGFTDEEKSHLSKLGSFSIKISPHRLRTELAATVLVGSVVQLIMTL